MQRGQFLGLRGMSRSGRLSIGVVLLGSLVLVGLLYRTQSHAAGIRAKTVQLAKSGRGINSATDAIIQLNRTNELAASILQSVRPVAGNLAGVGSLVSQIDSSVGSIKQHADAIEGSSSSIAQSSAAIRDGVSGISSSAGSISASLQGINANAAGILAAATAIRRGVELISTDLATTARITDQILSDAQGIHTGVERTEHLARCIDNGLNGNSPC
jgi:hypothetical protein